MMSTKDATQFHEELLASVETLSAIAEVHGPQTLADIAYLQHAILTNGKIDSDASVSAIEAVVSGLPSADRWMKYIRHESDAASKRYWAVSGRIPNEDDDSHLVFFVGTREEAEKAFDRAMWKGRSKVRSDRAFLKANFGTTTFVNSIVSSTSPIVVEA